MASKQMAKGLKRSTLTVALGLCFAGGVQAQSSVGSIFGDTTANAAVTIENLDTGTSREITSDASGHFTFTQLSPGRYRITSGGVTREVLVKVGTGTQVAMVAGGDTNTLDTVTVVGSSAINPIDVSSVESTTVFTQEQIQALPVGRDITNVALLAPGTVKGDTGFGNLASFGGSSVAENGYYINGFDVTNIFNFLSYSDMPFDAIAEQQVKTGGYGAEYGRSLGGVISLVTKRGTNEWKGGASVYWNPESLREHSDNVLSRDPAASASTRYFAYRADNTADSLSYNVYGGGPIIKDRLFVFGLLEGKNNSSDSYGSDTSQSRESSRPNGMVKLDWNITDNHLFELTAITNRDETDYVDYANAAGQYYTGEHGTQTAAYTVESGGEIYTAKYTGYFTDNFTLSAQVGQLKSLVGDRSPALLGSELCPRAFDSRGADPGATLKIGCWNEAVTFIRDLTQPPDEDKRDAFRVDGEWRLGSHQLRFGLDYERFASLRAGVSYTGGIYYRYFKRVTPITVRGVVIPAGTDYVRTWDWRSTSGDFKITNQAAYIEDSWQATDNLMLYLGLRGETFENKNADGIAFAESDTLWAPRLGFSWDVKGDASMKVFGNAGRYYIPVAGNTSVRMAGAEGYTENFYYYSGQIDPVTGAPVGGLGAPIGATLPSGNPVAPDPRTVAAINLSPMYQDEFILGAQFEMPGNWMLGARGVSRKVKSGMDDFCGHKPYQQWAEDNGYDGAWVSYYGWAPQCVLINPGQDVEIALDLYGDGELTVANIPASYFGLPKFSRSYSALEIFFERHKVDNWYLQGSYTFSKSKGTSEGYVNSTLEQTDAGITQDFDFKPFTDGTYGYLPNDRRHALKVFGAYEITDEWQVGANLLVQSGRPQSCYGYIPLDDPSVDDSGLDTPVYDYYLAANWSGNSFYCKSPDGTDTLGSRGNRGRTPWTRSMDASLSYTPNWASGKLTLGLKVFNVFNNQSVTEYNEFSARGGNAAQEYDPNFGNVVNYQAPRSAQLLVRYEF
ncbi:MAG TPA: TonB-dependent receptor [Thermomonas sp.]|nr:TonB-dependent receptor [Thermomonas sp.]